MKKIDNAIEKEMMESGSMGTESVTVNIYLTDDEKEEFMDSQKYDTDHYFWEFDGNMLTISYTEEI